MSSLYDLTNIPRRTDSSREVVPIVSGPNIHIVSRDIKDKNQLHGMSTVYIGDHMFLPENRNLLRTTIGELICSAITRGRDAGYTHAQSDVRAALGITT